MFAHMHGTSSEKGKSGSVVQIQDKTGGAGRGVDAGAPPIQVRVIPLPVGMGC